MRSARSSRSPNCRSSERRTGNPKHGDEGSTEHTEGHGRRRFRAADPTGWGARVFRPLCFRGFRVFHGPDPAWSGNCADRANSHLSMKPGRAEFRAIRGCSLMVKLQPSKLATRVRFPSPAPPPAPRFRSCAISGHPIMRCTPARFASGDHPLASLHPQ